MSVTIARHVCRGLGSHRHLMGSVGLMTTNRPITYCKNNGSAEETSVGSALLATHGGGASMTLRRFAGDWDCWRKSRRA